VFYTWDIEKEENMEEENKEGGFTKEETKR